MYKKTSFEINQSQNNLAQSSFFVSLENMDHSWFHWFNHFIHKSYWSNHTHLDYLSERDDYGAYLLRQKILATLKDHPHYTIGQLSIRLDVNINTLKYHIRYLKQKHELDYIGKPYHGYWKIMDQKQQK